MNSYPAGISLCMIVKDEEYFLDGALRSVAGVVDEICIVDTGSSDRTVEIALAHGARVVHATWQDDFASARNAALALATRRWIFVLDADERLSAESRAALTAIAPLPTSDRGRWIACRNLTDARNGAAAMTNLLVRIFPNDPRIRYRNAIHEFIALDGSAAGLPADRTAIEIVHHGYLPAVIAERKKGERNVRLARISAQRDPGDGFHQYNLGMASLLAGDRAGAIAALDRMRDITRITPRGYRVHGLIVLAELYADYRGDAQMALELVAECLALVPSYSNAHFVHGKLLARSGQLFEARSAFGRAIAAGAHDGEQFVVDNEIAAWKGHREIGATLVSEKRYTEALAWFDLAASARPDAPLATDRAICYEALGDFDRAREHFAGAFAADAGAMTAVPYINFLLRRDELDPALAAIDRALGVVDGGCAVLLLATAAAAQLRAGQRERAQISLERALEHGDRSAVTSTIAELAALLDMPELDHLLPRSLSLRAKPLHIAYAP